MSLHLTIGLLTTTYRHVLRRMVDRLADPALDQPLPIGFATSGAAEHTSTLERDADLDRGGARRVRSHRHRTARDRPASAPHSSPMDRTVGDRRGPDSSQRRHRRAGPSDVSALPADGATVVVDSADRRLRLPVRTRPALERLAAGTALVVQDLPELDADDRLVVVRRLVREGLLEVIAGDAERVRPTHAKGVAPNSPAPRRP